MMTKTMTNEIFLDTSVVIRRKLGSSEIKKRIEDQIKSHQATVTGLVVRQEFKRRVLEEAQYLLNQLNDKGSLQAVYYHVVNVLPPKWERKRKINLDLMGTLFPDAEDAEKTERLKRLLRTLLVTGLQDFDEGVSRVVWDSGCACSKFSVTEKRRYVRYDFGPKKCSKTDTCSVVAFLEGKRSEVERVSDRLRTIPTEKKTTEIRRIEVFIQHFLEDPSTVGQYDPCLKVGDLLIALESVGISTFYTMNSKESQHLCRALDQNLVLRSNDPAKDDITHLSSDEIWAQY